MRHCLFGFLLIITTEVCGVPGAVVTSLPAPGSCPTGIAWDGRRLWVADRKAGFLYQVEPSTGEVRDSIPSPGLWPMGLAWDGRYLWSADLDRRGIFRIDTESGVVNKTVACPASEPSGIAWAANCLWVVDGRARKIYKVDPDDGTVLFSFVTPSSRPTGLCFDGTYFWLADRSRDEIYMMSQKGEVITILSSPSDVPHGLAWDSTCLWNADYGSDSLYKIRVSDGDYSSTKKSKDMVVELTHVFGNYGPGMVKTLDFYVAIPMNLGNQELLGEPEFDPEPFEFLTDRWDQRFAHYRFENLPPTKFVKPVMTVKARLREFRYYLFPERIATKEEIPDSLKEKWLADGTKYCINSPVIKKAVEEAVGAEENCYWIARKIFNHVIAHLKYERTGGWERAPVVLERGTGSCSEYSFVFIAMCRAAGLPARYVGAVQQRGDEASWDRVFHRWAEVYLPPYGWISFDPAGGDRESPRSQAMAIGRTANRYLITTKSGGDSEYLGWTYNSETEWQFEGKCRTYSDHYADWAPLVREINAK